jgi:hypothetical protein
LRLLVMRYARSELYACTVTPRKVSSSLSCFHEKPSLLDCHTDPLSR